MIVTIDGPAGTGKSTVAREVSRRLGFGFLDTGAMYRSVALAAARQNLDPDNDDDVSSLLTDLCIDMPPDGIYLNGEDVSHLIRTPQISSGSSKVAVHACVRTFLVTQQRLIASRRDFVCEGRDQGTVVFPGAECKIFLTASAGTRAERRLRELQAKGAATDLESVLADIRERDERDSGRAVGALRPADDAVIIDTSEMGVEEVIAAIVERASGRR